MLLSIKIMSMISLYVSIALGGAIGACLRYFLNFQIHILWQGHLALGTLFVNILGSLCIGFCYVYFDEKAVLPIALKPFIMTGLLGAFTTFSTFSLDTIMHIHQGQWLHALAYTLLSISGCFIATYLAIELARHF